MKNRFLATTALAAVSGFAATGAMAAEAPEWKLSGNMNFQFYFVNQDFIAFRTDTNVTEFDGIVFTEFSTTAYYTLDPEATQVQDHGWYFGVDEAELQLNVSGTADNGLNYGFKIEINANTDDGKVADEARISLSGGWGTLHLGDEDGAEDTMNYGGEDLMGATGGFDGDFDDVLIRGGTHLEFLYSNLFFSYNFAAPSYPSIAGDTSDKTKITYYSPRFSGFQVGASITPTPNDGDGFKEDGDWENHYGLGANYDNTFGSLRIRASAVYSAASSNDTDFEDIAAWSVGGIVGFGPFSLGGNYTDNGDSGQLTGEGFESSYWNVAAAFETGPLSFSAGYFASTLEAGDWFGGGVESTFETIALTADYTVAPGLGVYAEVTLIEDDILNGHPDYESYWSNSATLFILGANVSF